MKKHLPIYLMIVLMTSGASIMSAQYCALTGQAPYSTLQPGITNFKINTINRTSGNTESTSGAIVYTGLTTTLTPGQTYTFSITHSEDNQFFAGARNNLRIWIDFNNDFDFTDAGETVLLKDLEPPATTYTATFTLPSAITSGTYTLRATAKMSIDAGHSIPTPCNVPADPLGYHGEMEDYMIIVEQVDPGQVPLASFATAGSICVLGTATVSNASTGSPTPAFSWSASPNGATFSPGITSSNPSIKFSAPGIYTVTCVATNSLGSSSASRTVTVAHCNPVGITGHETNGLSIFPNPNSGTFSIRLAGRTFNSYSIYDHTGKLIQNESLKDTATSGVITLNQQAEGFYFIVITHNAETIATKHFYLHNNNR
jgi:hypothetical protein